MRGLTLQVCVLQTRQAPYYQNHEPSVFRKRSCLFDLTHDERFSEKRLAILLLGRNGRSTCRGRVVEAYERNPICKGVIETAE